MGPDAYQRMIDQIAAAAWDSAFGPERLPGDTVVDSPDLLTIVRPLLSPMWTAIEAFLGGAIGPEEAAEWRPVIRGRLLDEIDRALRHPDGAIAAPRFYALVTFGVGGRFITLAEVHQVIDAAAHEH